MADQPNQQEPRDQQLFSNLIASNPKKEGAGASSALASTVFHAALIVLAVYLTQQVRNVVAESDNQNILIPVPEQE